LLLSLFIVIVIIYFVIVVIVIIYCLEKDSNSVCQEPNHSSGRNGKKKPGTYNARYTAG
jgi:hypothetical protein